MSGPFLETTSSEGLRLLGTAPQRSYELVSDTVARALGPRHAALFAEPVAAEFGNSSDWYARVPGKPSRLAALDATAQAALRADLAALRADIAGLAARIAAKGQPEDLRLAEALTHALESPGDAAIWAVTGADGAVQPVLVNWARLADSQPAAVGRLEGRDPRVAEAAAAAARATAAAAQAVPVGAPTQAAGAGPGPALVYWSGWIVLAGMIAAILWLMIPACALRPAWIPGFCPPPPALAAEGPAETERLEDEIGQLVLRIADADRACQPLPPPPPEPAAAPALPEPPAVMPPAPAPEPERTEIDRRLDAAGAQRGELSFSLAWNSRSDLDLHVTCPSGRTVYFRARSGCGGRLDVDANAEGRLTDQPVENIYFDQPGGGVYGLRVNLYASATGGQTERFQVQIRDRGRIQVLEGAVSPGRSNWTAQHRTGQ